MNNKESHKKNCFDFTDGENDFLLWIPNVISHSFFFTPLHWACKASKVEVVQELLRRDELQLDIKDKVGKDIFLRSSRKGFYSFILSNT